MPEHGMDFGGSAAAGVEAAGGGSGGGYNQGELANALADALAAGMSNQYDVGGVAVQDLEAQGQAFNEAQAAAAPANVGQEMFADGPPGGWVTGGAYSPGEQQRMDAAAAAEQARQAEVTRANMASTYDPGGIGAAPSGINNPYADPAFVDTFSSSYASQPDTTGGWETFGYNPQGLNVAATYDPTIDQLSPGEQQRVDAQNFVGTMATEEFDSGIPGEFGFVDTSKPAGGTQGYSTGVGTGVESFAGMPGMVPGGPYGTMATEEFDTPTATMEQLEMGMPEPLGSGGSPNVGMITAGTSPYGDPLKRAAKPGVGAITAGTPIVSPEDAVTEAAVAAGTAGTPAGTQFFGEGDVGTAAASPAGTRLQGAEFHAVAKGQIDKSIMDMSARLAEKAKTDPNGIAIKNTNITNQRLANAFNSLDQYSKAYAATQGGSFLGGLIEGAIPFGSAFKSFEGWLQSKGMYSKQTGEDLLGIMKSAIDTGDLSLIVRETLGGGGPSTEDVEGPKEIRSFIQQYPWAAELDQAYIKYLIDNPAALQDLLGQGPGPKPVNGGVSDNPPGFPGYENLPANWAEEGFSWQDPNNPKLSYYIIA